MTRTRTTALLLAASLVATLSRASGPSGDAVRATSAPGAAGVKPAAGAGETTTAPSTPIVQNAGSAAAAKKKEIPPVGDKLELTDAEWKKRLTPEQYKVLREQGTERAFTGALWNNHEKGTYVCSACGAPLFASDTKFESGTGWPSFWQPIEEGRVAERIDKGFFSVRTEVHCDRCGGHLGHVFPDGPKPTGLRYCMNSVSLRFESL